MRLWDIAATATVWGPPLTTKQSVEIIEGVHLRLRLIAPDDADYVYGLRTDPAYNTHLSAVQGTAADQRRWIESYKAREEDLRELYYVIERREAVPCGLVRLYGITRETFTWGSWILDRNKPPKAALESALLSFGVGLRALDIPEAHFEVQRDNAHAAAFYRRFGATQKGETEEELFFSYSRAQYDAAYAGFMAIIQGEQPE